MTVPLATGLAGGTTLRSATAADAEGLRQMITGLSPTSSYRRFLGSIAHRPSPRTLELMLRSDAERGAWQPVGL